MNYKIGDRFISKSEFDAHAWNVMKIVDVKGKGDDAIITYLYRINDAYTPRSKTAIAPELRKDDCRGWWIREHCVVLSYDGFHFGIQMNG